MKSTEYVARINTGDILHNISRRRIYASVRYFFACFSDAYLAEISYDSAFIAYVWRTPKGIYVETLRARSKARALKPHR